MGPSGAAEEEVTLASFLLAAAHWMRPRARSFSWLAALAAASRSALFAFSSCALAALVKVRARE
jgi:hypothetical protein